MNHPTTTTENDMSTPPLHLDTFTPGFRAIIRDASAAGLEVTVQPGRALVVVRRHKRTGRILQGMILWGNGTATDPTVDLRVVKGIRRLTWVREALELPA